MTVKARRNWYTEFSTVNFSGDPLNLVGERVIDLASTQGRSTLITGISIHGLTAMYQDADFLKAVKSFDVVTIDGVSTQNVLWASAGGKRPHRVTGTDLTCWLLERAHRERVPVYFYGSRPETIDRLIVQTKRRYPDIEIVGAEPSLFRPLNREEKALLCQRVRNSGAQFLFLGLGCPLQEKFAAEIASQLAVAIVCSGAAFDFIAGTRSRAPAWMQRFGLEWLHRITQEPTRLGWRYLACGVLLGILCGASLLRRPSRING